MWNDGRISTHTSRVGCDVILPVIAAPLTGISTHTSRVGCDLIQGENGIWNLRFLLTHPVWDVTHSSLGSPSNFGFLLTHPVWDVTSVTSVFITHSIISTHTSRVGCDKSNRLIVHAYSISTHTSRVGCDLLQPLPK